MTLDVISVSVVFCGPSVKTGLPLHHDKFVAFETTKC